MIQEVELQLVMLPIITGGTPPAIKAPAARMEHLQKDTILVTPDTVAKALESTVGLNFDHYYKKKKLRTGRREIPPNP